MVKYTKFSKTDRGMSYKKLKLAGFCENPTKTKIKITRYHHKNPGKIQRGSQIRRGAQARLTDFWVDTI